MIEKMKAVSLVTKESKKEETVNCLSEMGILHIAFKKSSDEKILSRINSITKLSSDLSEYLPKGKGKGKSKEKSEILSDEEFEKLYAESISALDKKAALKGKISELEMEKEKLKAWGDFDASLIRELNKDFDFHFYRMDKKALKKIKEDEDIKFISLASVEKMETVAVLGELDSSLGAMEFIIPKKGLGLIEEELNASLKELEDCEAVLKNSAMYLESCKEKLLSAYEDAEFSSTERSFSEDGGLIWISGYIPESEAEDFVKEAKAHNWAWLINDVAEDDEAVPTKIKYNKLTGIIKPIFDLLGVVPGYREYDISFWFLAFFTLFFAMIIGDAGYGVIFLLGALIFNLKTKKVTNIIMLLYILSAGTIVWGALTGTWFGLEGAMNVPILKAMVLPAIANYPEYFNVETGDVQNNVMRFCFSIGVIQLALACIMNIRRKISEKNLSFVSDLGWLLSVSALYFVVLNLVIGEKINIAVAGTVVGVGFLLVILFGGMEKGKSFFAGLKSGLGNIFTVFLDTISAFGNIMSYIRLFAVGMASLAIAQSFNDMASGFSGAMVIVGAIIMAIGHILNIVMGFLSVVVHGVRLNLLEFSGQLGMEWSGTLYKPFKKIKKSK